MSAENVFKKPAAPKKAAVKKAEQEAPQTPVDVKEEVKAKVDTGEFITKEAHEKAVEKAAKDAADEANKKHEEETNKANVITSRLDEITGFGIDLKHVISEEGEEELTIEQIVRSVAVDDEKGWNKERSILKRLATTAAASQQQQQTEAERLESVAANTGTVKKTKKPNPGFLVGSPSGNNTGKETADTGKRKFGKNAITVV